MDDKELLEKARNTIDPGGLDRVLGNREFFIEKGLKHIIVVSFYHAKDPSKVATITMNAKNHKFIQVQGDFDGG